MDPIFCDLFNWLLSFVFDGLVKPDHILPMAEIYDDGMDGVTRFIDEWAGHLINKLTEFTKHQVLDTSGVKVARQILALGILFVLGYEMWPVIMGKKSPDIIVLFKPFMLFMVITGWTPFINAMMEPGDKMAEMGRTFYKEQWAKMGELEIETKTSQNRVDSLRHAKLSQDLAELEGNKEMVKQESEEPGAMDPVESSDDEGGAIQWIGDQIDKLENTISNKFSALWNVMKDQIGNLLKSLMEWLTSIFEKVAKWVSMLYLQMNFYGIMMIGQIGMAVLALFGPIIFALSIFDVWADNWARWMMQFLSYSMYGFLCWLVMGYTYAIVMYELTKYKEELDTIKTVADVAGKDGLMDVLGSNFGILINWLVSLWTGGYCMKFVPEIAGVIFNATGSSVAGAAADSMKEGAKSTVNMLRGK